MISKIINKYRSMPVTVKATFWFTICSFILKGISFITVPIFARILSTTEYGKMSIYYSYEQIFLIFSTLELSAGAYQRGLLEFKEDEQLFTTSVILLGNILTIIIAAFFISLSGLFVALTNMSTVIMVLMLVYFFVQPAYNVWLNKKRFNIDYKPAVVMTILFTVLTTFISLFFVTWFQKTAQVKIGSVLLVEILFCIPFYIKNIKLKLVLNNFKSVISYWKYCLAFQLPLLFHSLSYLVLSQSDRIMIGIMVNESKAAIYSVAYNLGSVVIIFQQAINQVFKPRRYIQMENGYYKSISENNNIIMVFIMYVICVFLLLIPALVGILFTEEYYEAIWTVAPVSIGVFFMYLYSVFSDIESYLHDTKYMAYASMICAIINIILNYFGIKLFGYIACAYTTLISYVLLSIMHYIYMRKSLKENSITERVYDAKRVVICSLLILALGGMILIGYKFVTINIVELVLVLICSPIIIKNFLKLLKTA